MNRNNFRKVLVRKDDWTEAKEGFFHKWADNCTVQESKNGNIGVGNYSIAIVEYVEGDVDTFLPHMIKFVDDFPKKEFSNNV